jgi:hypothetical protein
VTPPQGRVQVDQLGADRVQEHPVVAGQHHRSGQPGQVLFQEADRGVVQVVGRLVQQQRPGLPDQKLGQPEPGALATGEGGQPPAPPLWAGAGQAEPGEHQLGPAVGVPQLVVGRPLQQLAVAVQGLGVIRPVLQPGRQLVEPPLVGADLAQRVVDHLGERGAPRMRQLLVQEPEVGGAADGTRVGLDQAGEHPQQGGLAGPVLTDQAHPLAGGGGQAHPVQDPARAVDLDNI